MKASQERMAGPALSERKEAISEGRPKEWLLFAVVVVASLALRLLVLHAVSGTPLASDSSDYREMALLLMDGRPFVPYWPPGLSLYLVPFLRAGLGDAGLRAAMLPWWLLFCLGFLRLSADLGVKKKISLVLLAVFSVTPALIHFSIEPMTQMPSAALLLLALSAAMRCSRRAGWGEALLLGLACGGLSLVRPSAIPLMIALPALVFLRRRRVAEPLAAVALGSVLICAWMVEVHQLSGQWTINNSNGANLYYGNNPWTPLYRTWYFGSHAKLGTEEIHQFPEYERIVRRVVTLPKTARGAEFKQLAMEYVLHRPDLFVLRTVNRVRCFWGFDTFTAANLHGAGGAGRRWFVPVFGMDAICYLMIAGYAFFWIAAAPGGLWSRWETWLLTATIVLYGLPYWVTMSHPTYHFPVIAPLALMGVMAQQLAGQAGGARWRGWAAVAVLVAVQVEWAFYLTRS
ncbi:hypothetical protein [Edaphobacter modestus]|uniref:Dolichyl-phosphate-mannose-protein mannosyltransferase n=1 Tax=Edaphobacter modestus TaxID=388466 RepID=A0A4Q7YTB4_9BACT|nr:hypothetical protein [Edaphobacter modestus]RZU40291.1 hypothetical protein BDD14_1737 [Edaphobacter modestus]